MKILFTTQGAPCVVNKIFILDLLFFGPLYSAWPLKE
jgi:hypothetical protein